ncbi:hypothetical protein PMKS-000858 [Pichia membranifaciens]|uniref:Uncharacterized protein n=1 Tax=Pichia membranifaciens TaxID=4926 RepID=A0A1Q2YD09_9ASCO|nr:hypothetical protein PMKS-000858 [Pichia membranifaciens]
MLGSKHGRYGRHDYKPLSPESLEKEYRREQFIKSPNINVVKTLAPRKQKRNILVYWLSSFRLYLSREGPALGPLPHGTDDLKKEHIQNQKVSQAILTYDLRAIDIQNQLLLKHSSRKQTKSDSKRPSGNKTPENEESNIFDFLTPPRLDNYPALNKIDDDEIFDLLPLKPGEIEKKSKPVPIDVKSRLTRDSQNESIQKQPLEGSFRDMLQQSREQGSLLKEEGKSDNDRNQNLEWFDHEGYKSKSPSSMLPQIPIPSLPNSRPNSNSIVQLRETELQPKQSPLSKKDLRRNSKMADVYKQYYEGLQPSRKTSHSNQFKTTSSEKSTKAAGGFETEEPGTPESSTTASTLTKEFTTPTLDPAHRPFFAPGQRVRMERYSMRLVEGSSQENSTNDFVVGFPPNEDTAEPLSSRQSISKPQQKVQAALSDQGSSTEDEEHVVFFDLKDSRRNSLGGGNLLHRSSGRISGSIKALCYAKKTGTKGHQLQ